MKRCEADDVCKKALPDLMRALEAVLARLARKPVDAERPDGELGPERVNDLVAASVIVGALGDMRAARGIPRRGAEIARFRQTRDRPALHRSRSRAPCGLLQTSLRPGASSFPIPYPR